MVERISQSIRATLEAQIFKAFADSVVVFSHYIIEKPEINIYLKSETYPESITKQ
jgi:hypothetical protein